MPTVFGISCRVLLVSALTIALAAPAAAGTLTVTGIAAAAEGNYTLTVPTVEIVDGSLDEAEVRAFFSPEGNANTLLNLVARSVSIPELRITGKLGSNTADPGSDGTIVLTGVALTGVANGLAGGFSVASVAIEGDDDATVEFGPIALENININHVFAALGAGGNIAGLEPGGIETLWSALSLGGATLSGEDGRCTLAGIDGGAVAVRLLERVDFAKLFAAIGESKGRSSPDDLAKLQASYYDMLGAVAVGPVTFSGIECNVVDDNGDPILLKAGEAAFGDTRPGTLPEMTLSNLRIENSGADAGWVEIQSVRVFPTGYAAVADAFADAGDAADGAWFTANQRRLIPSIGGFEVTGLTMDVPNEQSLDTRVTGGIAYFAVQLDNYVNGIPTDIRSSASGVSFEVPADQSGGMLTMLGLDPLNLSYDLALHWDRAAQEIIVDNLMLSGDNAGTIIVSGVIGNATPQIYSTSQAISAGAREKMTLKELRLHVADAGLMPKLIAMMAAQQNVAPDAFRAALASMAQGMLLVGLGGTPDSIQVAGAIGTFLSTGGELSLSAVALSPAGVSSAEMQEGQGDPTKVLKKFAITAGQPVPEAVPPADDAATEGPEAMPAPPQETAPAEDGGASGADAGTEDGGKEKPQ